MTEFITSDSHYGHGNILTYEAKARQQFGSIEEMDRKMVMLWNSVVKPGDKVWHLGDFAFYGKVKIKNIVNQLNGNINLILGNHDFQKRKSIGWWLDCGFKKVFTDPVWYIENKVLLCHDPISGEYVDDDVIVIHGHIHSKDLTSFKPPKYHNVCVEKTGFKPVILDEIIDNA